jgi:hypothetical protein
MTVEYGAFNAEGCFEAEMYSLAEAEAVAAAERAAGDEDAYASAMCHDHEGEPAFPKCQVCAAEFGEDDDELGEDDEE